MSMKAGTKLRRWSPEEIEWLCQNYRRGESEAIGRFLGRKPNAVSDKASQLGLGIHDQKDDYPWNTYFNSLDDERAYWLGFLWADGSVSDKQVKFQLTETDREAVERFRLVIGSWHTLYEVERTNSVGVAISSCGPMIDKLAEYGIVPNKTYQQDEPQIPDQWFYSFVRGLLDGDGWVSQPDTRPMISITNTLATCYWLKYRIGGNVTQKKGAKGFIYGVWNIGGKKNLTPLYHQLYDNAEFYLARKHDLFLEAIAS